jgi:hypothetical protein
MHSNALGVLDTIKNDTLLDILGDKKWLKNGKLYLIMKIIKLVI